MLFFSASPFSDGMWFSLGQGFGWLIILAIGIALVWIGWILFRRWLAWRARRVVEAPVEATVAAAKGATSMAGSATEAIVDGATKGAGALRTALPDKLPSFPASLRNVTWWRRGKREGEETESPKSET